MREPRNPAMEYDPEDHSDIVLAFEKKFFDACGNPAKCATLAHELAMAVALRERRYFDGKGEASKAYREGVKDYGVTPPTFREFLRVAIARGTPRAKVALEYWSKEANRRAAGLFRRAD